MPTSSSRVHLIELSLHEVGHLFNTMDPSPIHRKDLAQDAEEFIISWAREHALDKRIALRVHLEVWPETDPTQLIGNAIRNYFANRARMAELAFRRLMRQGRASLVIGLGFLAACLFIAELVGEAPLGIARVLGESLRIAGWVAMWKPMEVYLYDWWPVRDDRRHFTRLSEMPIEVAHIQAPAV